MSSYDKNFFVKPLDPGTAIYQAKVGRTGSLQVMHVVVLWLFFLFFLTDWSPDASRRTVDFSSSKLQISEPTELFSAKIISGDVYSSVMAIDNPNSTKIVVMTVCSFEMFYLNRMKLIYKYNAG